MRINKLVLVLTMVSVTLCIVAASMGRAGDIGAVAIQQKEILKRLKSNNPETPNPKACPLRNKRSEAIKQAEKKKQGREIHARKKQDEKKPKVRKSINIRSSLPAYTSPAMSRAKIEAEVKKNAYGNVVLPEIPTVVSMSNTDVNRITSYAEIKDVIYSKEKGVLIKYSGKDCYVKFTIQTKGKRTIYSTTPSELFIVSGGNVYNIIACPEKGTARTIRLMGSEAVRIKENEDIFRGMPLEKKVLSVIKHAFKDNVPESFTVTEIHQEISFSDKISLSLLRRIAVDGEGIILKVYQARVSPGFGAVTLTEKDFLRTDLTTNTIAIAIDHPHLKTGEISRIYICERNQGELEAGLSTTVIKSDAANIDK